MTAERHEVQRQRFVALAAKAAAVAAPHAQARMVLVLAGIIVAAAFTVPIFGAIAFCTRGSDFSRPRGSRYGPSGARSRSKPMRVSANPGAAADTGRPLVTISLPHAPNFDEACRTEANLARA